MKIKRKFLHTLMAAVILTVWAYGFYCGQYVKSYFNSVSVRMHNDMLTKEDILIALENEKIKGTKDIPAITAWKRVDDQKFECRELATTANLAVMEFWGDVTQVMPVKLLRGSIITKEDETGCMIDENAAYRLFRTKDAVGRRLTYRDKSYRIRGVIHAGEDVKILPVTDDKNSFSNLEFVYSKKESGKKNVNEFMEENGLTKDYTIVEGCFYARLLQIASGLPLWLFSMALLYMLVKVSREEMFAFLQNASHNTVKGKQKEKIMKCLNIKGLLEKAGILAIFVIAAVLFARMAAVFITPVPDRYIPTRWSDFSFWANEIKKIRKQRIALEYLAPATRDILLFKAVRRCIASGLITSVLIIIATFHITIRGLKKT